MNIESKLFELTGDQQDAGYGAMLLTNVCHQASFNAGWWKNTATGGDLVTMLREPKPYDYIAEPNEKLLAGALVAQKLCLIHSEISEAMEGHRKGLMDDKLTHRKMIEVELADAMIRIADLAGALGLDLGGAVAEKLAFNAQRPDHKLSNRTAEGGKSY